MPKQVLKISRFEGGINTGADPRDIPDNMLVECTDAVVDSLGRIKTMGSSLAGSIDGVALTTQTEHEATYGSVTQEVGLTFGTVASADRVWADNRGTGLFEFAADYEMLEPDDGTVYLNGGGDKTEQKPSHYLSVYATNANQHAMIFQKELLGTDKVWSDIDAAGHGIDLGGDDKATLAYYFARGGLRICDFLDATDNVTKWRGLIKARRYGFATSGTANGGLDISLDTEFPLWYTTNQEIKACFPEDDNGDGDSVAINAICGNSYISDIGAGAHADLLAFANEDCDTGTGPATTTAANSGMYWGAALETGQTGNGNGTWMPTTSTRYKFYITTVYDEGTQESKPQLMSMYPSTLLASDGDYLGETAKSEFEFPDTALADDSGLNIAAYFLPIVKINGAASNSTVNSNNFNFGATAQGETGDNGNKRISGVNMYWASNEDGYTNLWLIFDCDFAKGVKVYGAAESTGSLSRAPWVKYNKIDAAAAAEGGGTEDTKGLYMKVELPDNKWIHPPKFVNYHTANQHSHVDDIHLKNFKSAVVVNQRVYAGNVKQVVDGVEYQFGDRLMKSPVGQYDKFPSSMFIDVVTEDGDDIRHLATFGDRILQFKRRKLYVINISRDTEFLESEHIGYGVDEACQVATTDLGIIWANDTGVFFYNGTKIVNLFEKGGQAVVSNSSWYDFLHPGGVTRHAPMVGYIPREKQALISQDNDDVGTGDIYLFDFPTRSWVYGVGKIKDDKKSNFINDYNGDLVYYDYNGSTMRKWTDSSVDTTNFRVLTKDWDFGQPAIRKKIYKVYVSYKGDASAVTLNYGINGDNDTHTGQFYKSGATGTSTNATASNTPFHSSTVGVDDWINAEFIPTTSINNIYSFQLLFDGTAKASFEINDISIIYRMKGVK